MNKKIIGIFIFMLLIIYTLTVAGNIIESEGEDNPNYIQSNTVDVIEIIQQMDEAMFLGYIENITAFGPRETETNASMEAGSYIFDEFTSMGLEVRFHNWSQLNLDDRNIEATLHGTDETRDDIYIICAHHDSVEGCPGADDDASGVAAVLSAANIMSQYNFEHTIRFVTFSGEEQGRRGSHNYALEAYENGDNIIGVLNADAIAYAPTEDDAGKILLETPGQFYPPDELYNFVVDVNSEYDEYINLEIFPYDAGARAADHYEFAYFGYPALWFFEYEFNAYYHSANDTIDKLNPSYGVKVTKLIIAALAELANSDMGERPYRPTIKGPKDGIIRDSYTYTVNVVDPLGKDVYYMVDWGDVAISDWIGPYNSGENVSLSHKWRIEGEYMVKVKAKNTKDLNSDWSRSLEVSIPKNKMKYQFDNLFERLLYRFSLFEKILNQIKL